jgi:hypothetical protein
MTLTIGNKYRKSDFGIDKSSFRLSEIIVEGELYMFFSMGSKYKNIRRAYGFVYECRCRCSVIPKDIKTTLQPHVFVHDVVNEPYEYLGKGLYEKRYDDKRNKIFFKRKNKTGIKYRLKGGKLCQRSI